MHHRIVNKLLIDTLIFYVVFIDILIVNEMF